MKLINKYLMLGLALCPVYVSQSVLAVDVTPIVYEDETVGPDAVYFNPSLGISPFIGFLGFEIQKGNHSIGVGVPATISYRYYFNPNRSSKFWGVYFANFDIEDVDKRVDGVLYEDFSTMYFGLGIGYRWLWENGWNVNASIAIQYYDDEYSNPGSSGKATETGVMPYPGVNVGYRF